MRHGRHTAPLGSMPRIVCAIVAGWLATSGEAADPQHTDADAQPTMRCMMVMGWPECLVVTAHRRDERLQDVALSITAFTAADIERRDLRDLHDIAQETSGLVYERYANSGLSSATVIRGMGQKSTTARIPNTAVFLDGIYLQRQSMLSLGLLALERVEVVKGPQNSQFGRNAFAGVVHYVTKPPTDERIGDFALTYGSGGRSDRRASVAGPLVANKLRGRLSIGQSTFDGHTANVHPFAHYGPANATNDLLGGGDDASYSAALIWTPSERWEIGAATYQTETLREPQPYYDLDGVRYAYDSGEFAGPPTFAWLGPTAANCLDTMTFSDRVPFPVEGLHAWCGEFPKSPPMLDDARLAEAGFGDTRGAIVVDPRSVALDARSRIARLNVRYHATPSMSLEYQFGYVEHEADSFGTVGGRSSLVGSLIPYTPVNETPTPPFITALGPPGSFGAVAATSIFNATPMEKLKATSHELRLTWIRGDLIARAGLHVSDNEDEDASTYRFVPPCTTAAVCRAPVWAANNPLAGRYIATAPVIPGERNVGVPHIFATGHGVRGDHAIYGDNIATVFGDVEWPIAEAWSLALEARYTREKKAFEQLSSTFGGPIPANVTTRKGGVFAFFTPRATLKWMPSDGHMLYGLVAKGVKTGGFNAVDLDQHPEQAHYDEERSHTFELGVKNRLFDNTLTLNAAVYRIDWQDIQGSEAANSTDAWTRDVIGNIGDADVVGFEVDGVWLASDRFFIDYSVAYSDAKYDEAIYLSAVAGAYSSWGCDDSVCRADGRVDGNQVERTSKNQYSVGFNYGANLAGRRAGWSVNARLDFNYRSRMYATPMNLAHNGSRTLANASVHVALGPWRGTLWARNIGDAEYVGNSFVVPSFTRYIVGLGARRTLGLTLRYVL